jgi:hypothetical protein
VTTSSDAIWRTWSSATAAARWPPGCWSPTRTPDAGSPSPGGAADAWQKGAGRWDAAKRIALANDPLNLLAVDASTNRAKGDGDTATWLPPDKSYRCPYVAAQVAVKKKYGLWVTAAEKAAMEKVLTGCPDQKLPTGGNPTKAPERFHAN